MPAKALATTPAVPYSREWTLIRNARQLLTLQGPSGARRGPAMCDIGVIPDASILIRNGVIDRIGPARRVENLTGARQAFEIDAARKIVMPAFVDAATTLISQGNPALLTMSKKLVDARVAEASFQCARYGCLTVGARTPGAAGLRGITKVLRAHQGRQGRPLRIRSVLSSATDSNHAGFLADCLLYVHDRNLATVTELDLNDPGLAAAPLAAAGLGYAIRFRSRSAPNAAALRLAIQSGAMSLIAPSEPCSALSEPLASSGCVRLYPACEVLDPSPDSAANVRAALSAGLAIALASDAAAAEPPPPSLYSLLSLAPERLGLTIEETITALTWNPASALRLTQSAGSIEAGKPADLIVLNVPDYHDLTVPSPTPSISLVMRAGRRLFGH